MTFAGSVSLSMVVPSENVHVTRGVVLRDCSKVAAQVSMWASPAVELPILIMFTTGGEGTTLRE